MRNRQRSPSLRQRAWENGHAREIKSEKESQKFLEIKELIIQDE